MTEKKTALQLVYDVSNERQNELFRMGKKIIRQLEKKFIKNGIPIVGEDFRPSDEWILATHSLMACCDLEFPILSEHAQVCAEISLKKLKKNEDKKE